MQEMVKFQSVAIEEIPTLVRMRFETRVETYSEIYPREWIEGFDFEASEERFRGIATDPEQRLCFMIVNGERAGYLCFGRELEKTMPENSICINMLYLLRAYQRRGIGSLALEYVRSYCREIGRDRFYNGCNMHNADAMRFYRAMGGIITAEFDGHENRALDQAVFEHFV